MYIRTTGDSGFIELISNHSRPETVKYSGDFPDDLYQTFSKGKYLFDGEDILLNPDWNEETQSTGNEDLPEDTPHRELLIEAGITTLVELQGINDKTSIPGIGIVKAGEINIYLTNL